ncbi:type I restriction endonuclease subunit R [Campylobacter upsaliensis]|uniref:type I restriction endonuclease subunit R n=1 Tax=Campylobacter upsaliensis TaxID=28080 RepID=UPI0022EA4ABD|nr:type I restriction endonuclease subunit R [Campylobacter upsaliensis]MEB2821136.1 type I restriction endonuclease subunit R [Campylobacter upsaliensis]
MKSLKLLAQNTTSTIAVEWTPSKKVDSSYQSEAQLEKELIATLQAQGYGYAPISDEKSLESNLRTKLEELNSTTLSDTEWRRFFSQVLSRANASIVEKSVLIQEDYIQPLERDNGSIINFKLIDKADIHKNSLQVINQYEATTPTRSHRYDVSILVNGLPLVHIELKRRGVSLKEAFNQINRYGRESFFSGNALFEFVQIFVISNGTQSKYYSNTTRDFHIKTQQGIKTTKTSNSFEFTSYFSDEKNTIIDDLIDFAKTFFARHTLLNILCRYCVLDVDRKLLVLRPYQIAACEKILQQIAISYHNKFYEKSSEQKSGGYIWHTTGSGKTLTSFKTAQLVSKIPEIAKVLFVVDRKDLDYQTMREYDRFQKGAATGSKSTKELQSRLNSTDKNHKIIITTIQKLSRFIAQAEKDHTIFNEHIVMIFDECHRSQFGQMQKDIAKAFKKLYLFGFTGTPIFAANALGFETTQRVFGECLHRYTIIHAIRDHNVLPFRVSYHTTAKLKSQPIQDEQVPAIDTEEILLAKERISHITRYILEHFTTQTKRSSTYTINGKHTKGFNALFATQSIPMAMRYYEEFQSQQASLPESQRLKVGIIYSYAPNDEQEEESSEDTTSLPKSQRDFLDATINDYNAIFACRFDSSADNFHNYYKDFSLKLKNRELDLAIVVNMFLTGFDATTLNTLYVDKSLRYHGLLQAYSRTNRILNSVKSFGNIIAFRDLQRNTDDALALFSDENAKGIVFLRSLEEYLHGYTDEKGQKHKGYNELTKELTDKFPLESFRQATLKQSDKKHFLALFGELLKLRNILENFDNFSDPLNERDKQDYQSHYISTYEELRKDKDDKESNLDEVEFEVELLAQVEVSIEYILELIAKYHKDQATNYEPILKLLDSSLSLRSKKELFLRFIDSLHTQSNVEKDFRAYIKTHKNNALQDIINALNLDPKKTKEFMQDSFERGELRDYGRAFGEILPPSPLFGKGAEQTHKIREKALEKLQAFFELFKGLDISNKEQ